MAIKYTESRYVGEEDGLIKVDVAIVSIHCNKHKLIELRKLRTLSA